MSELPNAGDLAICVQVCGCASSLEYLGRVVRVEQIVPVDIPFCARCGSYMDAHEAILVGDRKSNRAFYRRIPPLSELESIDKREQVPA